MVSDVLTRNKNLEGEVLTNVSREGVENKSVPHRTNWCPITSEILVTGLMRASNRLGSHDVLICFLHVAASIYLVQTRTLDYAGICYRKEWYQPMMIGHVTPLVVIIGQPVVDMVKDVALLNFTCQGVVQENCTKCPE